MVWVRTSCMCACACEPVFVCHPSGFEGPKRLLPERHHCIFSGERGHEVWTDMEVAGVAVEREGKEGVGRERQREREEVWNRTAVFHRPADVPSIPPSLNVCARCERCGGTHTHAETDKHTPKHTAGLGGRAATQKELASAGTCAVVFQDLIYVFN